MMRFWMAGAAALLWSGSALADMRATYLDGEEELVAEVNDDGRTRLDSEKAGEYTLIVGDEAYMVFNEGGVSKAASMRDFRAVIDAMMVDMWKSLGAEAPKPAAGPAEAMFVKGESVTVNGRMGTSYRERADMEVAADGAPASILVLSDDPTLAPLGAIWARLASMVPPPESLLDPNHGAAETAFAKLVNGRGVLKLDTIELKDVVSGPIDDARFALPTTILTRDEVKAMLEKDRMPVD